LRPLDSIRSVRLQIAIYSELRFEGLIPTLSSILTIIVPINPTEASWMCKLSQSRLPPVQEKQHVVPEIGDGASQGVQSWVADTEGAIVPDSEAEVAGSVQHRRAGRAISGLSALALRCVGRMEEERRARWTEF